MHILYNFCPSPVKGVTSFPDTSVNLNSIPIIILGKIITEVYIDIVLLVRLINLYTFYATYIIIVQIRKVQEKEVKMDWIHLSGVDELK